MKTTASIMTMANTPVITILCLAGFLWLGAESRNHEDANVGYSAKQRSAVSDLLKPKKLDRRAAVMSLWNLTEADVSKPVDLFGENGGAL